MGKTTFKHVLEQALELEPEEQLHLAEELTGRIRVLIAERKPSVPKVDPEDAPLTEDELKELLRSEPMTGAEIIAAGLTGTWADLDIEDGAEWVNEQKRRRQERNRW
jgi:hypothetical protein